MGTQAAAEPTKRCSKCAKTKPISTFQRSGTRRGQPQWKSACKNCQAVVKPPQPVASQPATLPERSPFELSQMLRDKRRESEISALRAEKETLLKNLISAEERQKVLEDIASRTPQPIKRRETASGLREATAVLMCSDWHVEEPVEAEKVNGMNTYDLTIADKRIAKLAEGAHWMIEMHRSKMQIRDLVLWFGGDLFSGYIHEELVETAQLAPVESVLWLQERLIGMIQDFLDKTKLDRIVVPCCYGNHGRNTLKKRIATGAENSYEWMMYQMIAQWFRNEPRVEVHAPKSILLYTDVYDFTLRFTHGDSVGYGGGVGGITIPINKRIASWDTARRANVTCMGHFHQYMSLPNLAMNGSLIGFNAFATSIGAKFEPPQQNFFLMDSHRGKTISAPIWVEDSIKAR